jgi:hypothetical protein
MGLRLRVSSKWCLIRSLSKGVTMCRKNGFTLLLLFLLFGLSLPCLSYSEEAISSSLRNFQPPENLWDELLSQTSSLPENFDNFVLSLTNQINSLQISNKDLTINNALLTESLKRSEIKAETSEDKSKRLQMDLDASTLSITQAQNEAASLEKLARFWSFIGKLALCVSAGEGIYIVASNLF